MFEDNDDFENEIENDFSDNEEVSDINLDDDDKPSEDSNFNLMTYKNILENISKNVKKTIPLLTKFERARIVGVRLQQLANGAKPRIDTSNLRSIKEIVEKELVLRKIPFIIRRTLPNGKSEDWKLEEFLSV
jgi:DNA-directed RNA polymerase I, II, and III subunit RPABC2